MTEIKKSPVNPLAVVLGISAILFGFFMVFSVIYFFTSGGDSKGHDKSGGVFGDKENVIGVIELTRTAQQIVAATYRPIEIWLVVGALYFVMCYALGALTRRIERATAVYRLH